MPADRCQRFNSFLCYSVSYVGYLDESSNTHAYFCELRNLTSCSIETEEEAGEDIFQIMCLMQEV